MTDKEFEQLLNEAAGERAENVEMKPDPRYTETRQGRTPNGGAYSTAYYYDEDGEPCPKAKAKSVHIVEFDENGERVNENYGILG
jgi:hypothetical protein